MKLKKNDGKVKGSISNVDNPAKQEKNRVTRNPQEKGRNHDDDDSESKDGKKRRARLHCLKMLSQNGNGELFIRERLGVGRSNRVKKQRIWSFVFIFQ